MMTWTLVAALAAAPKGFAPDVTQLNLENSAGEVVVRAGGDHIRVTATPRKDGPDCELRMEPQGKVAVVTFRATKDQAECVMDFDIQLPASSAVDLTVGAGNVDLLGLRGDVDLQLGAGNVELEVKDANMEVGAGEVSGRASGGVSVDVGAGSVELEGLVAPIHVNVGTGSIDLAYAKAPQGRVRGQVGIGNVTVQLPAGTQVQKAVKGNSGLRVDPTAPTALELEAGMGGVTVQVGR